MNDTVAKIASGLERAFAERGFAKPSVEDLRDAACVSLRTLYKYAPSRDAMILMALEHRHKRYLAHMFGDPDHPSEQSLIDTLDRVADWMRTEASHGCLFHSAVASAPNDPSLRELLERHKTEISLIAVARAGTNVNSSDVLVIIEGLTQSWSLSKDTALNSAKRIAAVLETARS